jgi:hypothetical protein
MAKSIIASEAKQPMGRLAKAAVDSLWAGIERNFALWLV